jgi:hypothetical protein
MHKKNLKLNSILDGGVTRVYNFDTYCLLQENLDDLFGSSLKLKPHEKLITSAMISFMVEHYNFRAQITVRKKNSKDMIGDISLTDTSVEKHKFFVHVNPNQSYMQIIKSLIHELTHVKQVVKGELLPNKDYTAIKWMGEEYITVKEYNQLMRKNPMEYRKLPWEVEADKAMFDLYDIFLNSNYWKSLRGKDTTMDFIMDNI